MRKGWRLALGGVGGFAFLALVGGLGLCLDYGRVADELPKAVRDYRAAGLPWTAADLAGPKIPRARNAAEPIRAAIAAWPVGASFYLSYEKGVPPTRVVRYGRALDLACLAAKCPTVDFERDWDLGPALRMPESRGIRGLITVLATRAEGRAERGDDLGALADLGAARRLAALLGEDPTVLSALGSAMGEQTAIGALRDCLNAVAANPARVIHYRALLAESSRLPDIRRVLRGMAYQAVATTRNLDRTGLGAGVDPGFEGFAQQVEHRFGIAPSAPPPVRREGLPDGTRLRAYLVRALQSWTELARSTHDFKDSPETIERQMERIGNRPSRLLGMSHNLDAILFPVYGWPSTVSRAPQATHTVTLAYADALLVHARTGSWPTTVAARDPWSTGLLRVRSDAAGFRVWSVGRDGKNGGGFTWEERRAQGHAPWSDDIVLRYPTPALHNGSQF